MTCDFWAVFMGNIFEALILLVFGAEISERQKEEGDSSPALRTGGKQRPRQEKLLGGCWRFFIPSEITTGKREFSEDGLDDALDEFFE